MSDASVGVVLGADSLLGNRSGIGRITVELARAALAHGGVTPVSLLIYGRMFPGSMIAKIGDPASKAFRMPKAAPWKRVLARLRPYGYFEDLDRRLLARTVGRLGAASRLVYHEPNMIAQDIDLPTVVTINDLAWRHDRSWHPQDRLRWIDDNIDATLRKASRFVAVSQFTKDQAVAQLGVPAHHVHVAWNAPAAAFRPYTAAAARATLSRHDLRDRGYILSVSTIEPRKNFDRLLEAFLTLPATIQGRFPLVIVGGQGWGEVLVRPAATKAVAAGSLRLLGHVADADLAPLYARARSFAYVSLYEGFGLPVVEAMATATPVVASSTTAVGEVAGDAALLVDPLDVDAIGQALRRVIEDDALALDLQARGLARASEFSWRRSMQVHVRAWREAL